MFVNVLSDIRNLFIKDDSANFCSACTIKYFIYIAMTLLIKALSTSDDTFLHNFRFFCDIFD